MAQKHRIFDPPQIRPHPKSLALGPLGDTTQRVETKLRPNWSRKGDIGLLVFYLARSSGRGGRGFPTPVFSRQLGLFLLGYRGVFSIFWKRFNMFFLITKPGGNEGKQAKTQTNPAEMPEDRRRWGPGWLGTSTEGPRGSLQTSAFIAQWSGRYCR